MTSKTRPAVFLAILFLCLVVGSVSHATSVPEKPARYVVDLAGIIDDATENRLNGYLQELEQKTTAQLVVLTIKSLEGEPIDDFFNGGCHGKGEVAEQGLTAVGEGLMLFNTDNTVNIQHTEVGPFGVKNVLNKLWVDLALTELK